MAYNKTTWVDNSSPYINATNLNHIENGIKDNETLIDSVNTELSNKIEGTVLWSNSNLTTNFSSQTITLSDSLNNYDFYEIIYKQNTTAQRMMSTGKIPSTYGTILNTTIGYIHFRPVNYASTTTLEIANNMSVMTLGTTTTDNSFNIPYKVIGYK